MKLEVKVFLSLLILCFVILNLKLIYDGTHEAKPVKENNIIWRDLEIREPPSNLDDIYNKILKEEHDYSKTDLKYSKFHEIYVSYLKYNLDSKDIFRELEENYGKEIKVFILENKDNIEYDLDKKTTLDLLKINSNYLKLDNSRKRKIYYEYLKNGKIINLIDEINNSKDDNDSAMLTYEIYLLFSNQILYLK